MIQHPFFPNILFGWIFYGVLVALCLIAAIIDYRQMRVPKWLTFGTLGAGIVFNIMRGVWLGTLGNKTWVLSANGPLIGGLDGFLFALTGFAIAFGLFFLLWILNVVGGGDAKMFAAHGSWVGAFLSLSIMVGSVGVFGLIYMIRIAFGTLRQGPMKTVKKMRRETQHHTGKTIKKTKLNRLLTYSFPLAVATSVMLLWFMRADLGLAPLPGTDGGAAVSQERPPQ